MTAAMTALATVLRHCVNRYMVKLLAKTTFLGDKANPDA
jgi:hypothetical protein